MAVRAGLDLERRGWKRLATGRRGRTRTTSVTTTGTYMFMWTVRWTTRCQRLRRMRAGDRLAVAL